MPGNINIKWENVQSIVVHDRKHMRVQDVLMTIDRHGADRTHDSTYDVERALLDFAGHEAYVHKIFELKVWLLNNPVFVEFTPTQMIIGLSKGFLPN